VLRSLCSAPLHYAKLPSYPPGAYLACNKCKCTYFDNSALIRMLINADAYGNPAHSPSLSLVFRLPRFSTSIPTIPIMMADHRRAKCSCFFSCVLCLICTFMFLALSATFDLDRSSLLYYALDAVQKLCHMLERHKGQTFHSLCELGLLSTSLPMPPR
jgi:hypothetical protein